MTNEIELLPPEIAEWMGLDETMLTVAAALVATEMS
jgi:hypothetical protein